MNVKLYSCSAENLHVNKTDYLTEYIDAVGTLRSKDVSIINPTILIKYDEDLFKCNYAYIPEFGRYYFITEFLSVVNGIVEISMHVDVLMSFKDEFLQNSGYVSSSQNYGNFYLEDNNMPVQQNTKITTVKDFDSPFSSDQASIIMNVLGLTSSYEFNVEE